MRPFILALLIAGSTLLGWNAAKLTVPWSWIPAGQHSFSLQDTESNRRVVKTESMTVTLRILDRATFYKTRGRGVTGSTDSGPDGCTIYIPAGQKINLTALRGSATWDDRDDGDTLAHELMHCQYGLWHPTWSRIDYLEHALPAPEVASYIEPLYLVANSSITSYCGEYELRVNWHSDSSILTKMQVDYAQFVDYVTAHCFTP